MGWDGMSGGIGQTTLNRRSSNVLLYSTNNILFGTSRPIYMRLGQYVRVRDGRLQSGRRREALKGSVERFNCSTLGRSS